MIQLIGFMIGAYIITRMVDLITRKEGNLLTVILAVITIVVVVISLVGLVGAGNSIQGITGQ